MMTCARIPLCGGRTLRPRHRSGHAGGGARTPAAAKLGAAHVRAPDAFLLVPHPSGVRRHGAAAAGGQQHEPRVVESRPAVGARPRSHIQGVSPGAGAGRAADLRHLRSGHAEGTACGVCGNRRCAARQPFHRPARRRRHADPRRLFKPGYGNGHADADLRRPQEPDARPQGHRCAQRGGGAQTWPARQVGVGATGAGLRNAAAGRPAAGHFRGGLRPRVGRRQDAARGWPPGDPVQYRRAPSQGGPRMKARGLFVTGTDTGVGKTRVAVALIRALRARGLRVAAMKPVSAGSGPGGLNEDVAALLEATDVAADLRDVNPYAFVEPIAPHIAAQQSGVRIDLEVIAAAHARLAAMADVVVVEGAGGWRVPLNEREDMADLAQALGLPVVLVVGMRLGCLNHALLTAESIAGRQLPWAGWVGNHIDPTMAQQAANLDALRARLPAPCLGVQDFLSVSDLLTDAPKWLTLPGELAFSKK